MSTVDNTEVCMACGEEYWYQFDCQTLEYTKISLCRCDRERLAALDFIKEKEMEEEFKRFWEERERERELMRCKKCKEEYYPDELDSEGLCMVCKEVA